MPDGDYLPRKLHTAFDRAGIASSGLRALVASIPANLAYSNWHDDFYGDQIGELYPASVGTGTQVITVTNTFRNGRLDLVTDVNDNDTVGQAFGFHWIVSDGMYFYARCKISSVASASFEIGLTDSGGNVDTGPVVTKDTPTFNATNAAVMCFDTDDDTNVTFITANAGAAGADADVAAADVGLASDTFFTVEIVVDAAGFASGYFNGKLVGGGAIATTAVLSPFLYCRARSGAAKTLTTDYIGMVAPRSLT